MKKCLLSAVALALLFTACVSAEDTRIFTDSTGREVEIPAEIDRIAITGPLTQIMAFALCPDKLVGISSPWDERAAAIIDTAYYDLPVLGQLYGTKGSFDPEALLASGAQLVLDMGNAKGSMAEDFEELQEQTGLPFVHIDAYTDSMGDAYRMLGDLLNMLEEAEVLARYCERIYADAVALSESVEKVKALYLLGEGKHVIAKGSYHAEIIDLMTDNQAVVDDPSSKGTGNEVDFEQLMVWDPEVILFAPDSVFETVGDSEEWQALRAVRNGKYYQVPFGPYNWLGFPPSVQRYLGMLWMGAVLYPDAVDYDLEDAVKEYFRLFYHCDLSHEQFAELTGME